MKAKPQRTCIACRQKKDKSDLIRITKNGAKEISLDKSGKADGRGAYLCDNIQCVEKCIKTRALNRSFKSEVSSEIYDRLKGEYIGKQ